MHNHVFSDSMSSVCLIHTYMIETSLSSIMTTENTSDDFSFFHCDKTRCRIPSQKPFDTFFRIVDTADSESPDLLP